MDANTGEGPFGHSQTQLLKYIFKHPGCSMNDIHEKLFNDKKTKYVSNLLYENQNIIHSEKYDNDNMPTKYYINVTEIAKVIDLSYWVAKGKFKRLIESRVFN